MILWGIYFKEVMGEGNVVIEHLMLIRPLQIVGIKVLVISIIWLMNLRILTLIILYLRPLALLLLIWILIILQSYHSLNMHIKVLLIVSIYLVIIEYLDLPIVPKACLTFRTDLMCLIPFPGQFSLVFLDKKIDAGYGHAYNYWHVDEDHYLH